MSNKKRATKTIRTTIGELAAAFYEAALAEVRDEIQAAKLAQHMMQDVVKNRRVLV